jgi:hypothetical protein
MGITVLSPVPPVGLSDSLPVDVGTVAAAGASSLQSRADHTHKYTHPDSGWLTPTLLNNWVVYDATFSNAAMYRKVGGIVYLRGLLKNGTAGAVMFTLPVGYRPGIRMLFIVDGTGGFGRIDVASNGDVIHTSGATGYFQISVSFVADG